MPYSLILKQYLLTYVALTIEKRILPVQNPFASFYIFGHLDFAESFSKIVSLVGALRAQFFSAETQGADWLNSVPSKIAEFSVRSAI